MKPFRTILHGTCLVDGRHPEGSKLARECPVLRRQKRHVQAQAGSDVGFPVRDAPNGQPGPKAASPRAARQRRYRAKHPEYQQREADRLKTRRTQG